MSAVFLSAGENNGARADVFRDTRVVPSRVRKHILPIPDARCRDLLYRRVGRGERGCFNFMFKYVGNPHVLVTYRILEFPSRLSFLSPRYRIFFRSHLNERHLSVRSGAENFSIPPISTGVLPGARCVSDSRQSVPGRSTRQSEYSNSRIRRRQSNTLRPRQS